MPIQSCACPPAPGNLRLRFTKSEFVSSSPFSSATDLTDYLSTKWTRMALSRVPWLIPGLEQSGTGCRDCTYLQSCQPDLSRECKRPGVLLASPETSPPEQYLRWTGRGIRCSSCTRLSGTRSPAAKRGSCAGSPGDKWWEPWNSLQNLERDPIRK